MPVSNCLLLKPYIDRTTNAAGLLEQQSDIMDLIRPAIRQAGLTLLGRDTAGSAGEMVREISTNLIRQAIETDVVVIDANRYDAIAPFAMSPFLVYFVALRHAFSNATILMARSFDHLPASLQGYHNLTYSRNNMREFFEQFEQIIKSIASEEELPDNPIQEYLRDRAVAEELRRTRDEHMALEAQLEALRKQQKQGGQSPASINFRKVN